METSDVVNVEKVVSALKRASSHFVPPEPLRPSDWAERHVYIPAGNAIPGPVRFGNAPYQREPMDMAADPSCRRVSLMWGAQTGKTLAALCLQGYHIAHEPRSQMIMQPSQGDLTSWLETKFQPMVDSSDVLSERLAKPRSHEGVNNQRMKSYPGGFMMFAWAGSTKTMRGRSAPVIVADEIDGYSGTEEGDEVELLWQRAATYGDERLLLEISTPTIKGQSRIETAFEAGDQRRFHVPCPHCGEHQALEWRFVHWQHNEDGENFPETAGYTCRYCGSIWSDGERIAAIRRGEWRARRPFRGHASYHLSELYSCLRRLPDIAQSFLDKKHKGDLQTFTNVSLAETWEEKGEQAESGTLVERAEKYPASIPAGGVVLTAGVDMQEDRLEVETVAWGYGEESWSIDYTVLWGDTLQDEVWSDLDDYLDETWTHESGTQLGIIATCLDTGGGKGGYTQRAYEYVRSRTGRRVFAIKGQGGWDRPVVSSPSRRKIGKRQRKVDLFIVGVDEAKLTIMRRLAAAEPGPGYCHFPDGRDIEWFHQLTGEKLVTKYRKGVPIREWHQTRPRNEALDCRVYAYAALKIASPRIQKHAQRLKPEPATDPAKIDQQDDLEPLPAEPKRKRRKNRLSRTGSARRNRVNKW